MQFELMCSMPTFRRGRWLGALAGLLACSTEAQIPMSGGAYFQDFDSLAVTGLSHPWVDTVTLPGWYASKGAGTHEVTNYSAGAGSGTAGALYSFGAGSVTDRALGSVASGATGPIAYGVRFLNDTGMARSNILISYTGEQWRAADAAPQRLTCWYQIGTALADADASAVQPWRPLPALDFIAPNTNATQSLNGNDPTNRVVFTNLQLNGAVVNAGQELFLRWLDANDAGADDGLALDNLAVRFGDSVTNLTPPPGTNLAFSLLTYNVKGNGAGDWSTNSPQVRAVGREMRFLQPDIITFQEIPYDLSYEMTNFVNAYLPGYSLARNSGTDGYVRSVIASRFPITRSTSWLDGVDLRSFGYSNANNNLDNFTRDLFEAEIAVPGFPQPLHVFTTHLKSTSGTTYADASAKRAAEAAAITNFVATHLLAPYPLHPFVLTGDFNDADTNSLAIQRLLGTATGLRLTNPKNPATGSLSTFSIQGNLNERIDYILANALLFDNIQASQVFRTDVLNPLPSGLNADDDAVASDHLPVLLVFNHPYAKPFHLTGLTRSPPEISLEWESVPGQYYRVETSADLIQWASLSGELLATDTNTVFSTNLYDEASFLRVNHP